jgi:hypothetical protein
MSGYVTLASSSARMKCNVIREIEATKARILQATTRHPVHQSQEHQKHRDRHQAGY